MWLQRVVHPVEDMEYGWWRGGRSSTDPAASAVAVRKAKIGMPADLQQVEQRSPPNVVDTAAGAASG